MLFSVFNFLNVYMIHQLGYRTNPSMDLSLGAKKDLLDLIKRKGVLSLEEATDALKLAKATLRQHMLVMESRGLVRRRYERTGQGRPKVVFELAVGGKQLYPTQEPTLLRELLEFLKASGQHSAIEGFFEKYWEKRKNQFQTIFDSLPKKQKDLERRLEALRILLESEGFMPQIKRTGTRFTVRECHCPYPEAIRATELPCRLESRFIRWALNTSVERTGYIPHGDVACSYSRKAN